MQKLIDMFQCCGCYNDENNVDILANNPNVETEHLEPFQNQKLKYAKLKDPYDQILRIQSEPFNRIYVVDFFDELEKIKKYKYWAPDEKSKGTMDQFEVQHMPLEKFIQHFSTYPQLAEYITDPGSAFNQLIFIEEVFIVKKKQQKDKKGQKKNDQNKQNQEVTLNLTNMKIFALLICQGTPEEKATLLFDLIAGHHADEEEQQIVERFEKLYPELKTRHIKKDEEDKESEGGFFGGLLGPDSPETEMDEKIKGMKDALEIEFENPLLFLSIKMMMFYSEILPKKYFDQFKNVNSHDKMREGIEFINHYETRESVQWTQAYVQSAQEKFDHVFKDVFETQFIDNIFPDYKSMITGKEFVDACTPQSALGNLFDFDAGASHNADKDGQCDFIFKPQKLRELFKNQLNDNLHESQSQKSQKIKTAATTAKK